MFRCCFWMLCFRVFFSIVIRVCFEFVAEVIFNHVWGEPAAVQKGHLRCGREKRPFSTGLGG